ncbi:MAG TPA: hypothetical protein VHD56_17140 [Tepidisphaeraceae bacterium]|nr:hypothetical protein [Tepidisphaeraceae bacterium]
MQENRVVADTGRNPQALCADTALRIASWTWFAFLAFPFIIFLALIWHLMDNDNLQPNPELADTWFYASMGYMVFAVPLAFFGRSRLFKGYWAGEIVPPREYLMGMILIWGAMEIGGLFALAGCLISGTLLPNLLPALLAFMLFTPLWPNGHAMTRPLVNEHDPGEYEEPR